MDKRGLMRPVNPVKGFMMGYCTVMVNQREALAVTIGFNDTFYLVRPMGIPTVNRQPLGQFAATLHFTTKLPGIGTGTLNI